MWPNSRVAITSVHLVENSSMMRSRQAQKLAAWRESQNIPFYWWVSIGIGPCHLTTIYNGCRA
ncbi:hypothetical protein JB92DRAFT_2926706 [Gautieria morchelliformis]|nr:hypothetical protein JB92DRAFT_2926706 [Gautieria morchelliformis]